MAVTFFKMGTGLSRLILVPSPNLPSSFSPVAKTVPSFLRNRLCLALAEMAITSVMTCTGLTRLVVVPSPSCPSSFRPVAHADPSFLRNRLCPKPAEMAATSFFMMRTGLGLSLVVPSPSLPSSFSPDAQTEPSFLRNKLCPHPAETAAACSMTRTGVTRRIPSPFFWSYKRAGFFSRSTMNPSPNDPEPTQPTAQTVPSFLRKRLCNVPAEAADTSLIMIHGVGRTNPSPPNAPVKFEPTPHSEPSDIRNRLWR